MRLAYKNFFLSLISCLLLLPSVACAQSNENDSEWVFKTSFKYDALAYIGLVGGDPYYEDFYPRDRLPLIEQLTPEAKSAFENIRRIIKDENGGIVSALLTLYYSAVDGDNLDTLIVHTQEPSELKEALQETPFYSDEGWVDFDTIRPDLLTVFAWYREVEFERYWQAEVKPALEARAKELRQQTQAYEVKATVEKYLGRSLANDPTTVYVQEFNKPHGIGLVGNAYITSRQWPLSVVLGNGPHELMHPPYEGERWMNLYNRLSVLEEDPWLSSHFENHDPSFGYNSWSGYFEENIIQALDQLLAEKMGISSDPGKRWRQADDGMHVFAAVLYSLLKDQAFAEGHEPIDTFIIRNLDNGTLAAGELQKRAKLILN